MECLIGRCWINHTKFWFPLEMIGVLCLYILVESTLFSTQMVKKWTRTLMLVFVVLMRILSVLGLWESSLFFFLVEVYAVLICCRICFNKGYRSNGIHFCSDRQASLLTLHRYNIASHIVWECYLEVCMGPRLANEG